MRGRERLALARHAAFPALCCRCRGAARSSWRRSICAPSARVWTWASACFAAVLLAPRLAFSAAGLAGSLFSGLAASGFAASGFASVLASALASVLASLLGSSLSAPARLRLFSLSRLEVGFVPARALQPEHRRGHELLQPLLAAVRALRERLVGDLLQYFFVVAAVWTFVFVERHGYSGRWKRGGLWTSCAYGDNQPRSISYSRA